MNRALLYLRVSSAEQVKGYSLDVQEKACRDYCTRESLEITAVYRDEGESATTTDRPELQRMLVDATKRNSGITHIVVYDLSRLTRDTLDHLTIRATLQKAGVTLRSATQTLGDSDEGEFVETVLQATSKLENRLRRRKVMAGMREAIERGRWVFLAPLGYRHAGKLLELDDQVAPLLRWAFEEAAKGIRSKDEIRRELRKRGLKIPRETLYRVLRNPFYTGRIVLPSWGIDQPGIHPPLVSFETFQSALREIRKRRSYVTGATETFPLRQITRCSCGRGLAGYRARGKGGARFPYYRCQRCRINVPAARLEARFTRLLESLSVDPPKVRLVEAAIREKLAGLDLDRAERAELANRRLAVERGRLERLIEAYVYRSALPDEEYRRMRVGLDGSIRTLEQEASIALSPSVDFEHAWTIARRLLETPLLVWDGLDSERRVAFVRVVFPAGLEIDELGEFRTPSKCLMRLPSSGISGLGVAGGTPLEADFEPLSEWISGLQGLRAVVGEEGRA